MGWQAAKAVWATSTRTGNAKLLMLAIAEHADRNGKAWPSIDRLAEMLGVSDRSIKRLIVECEEAGELFVERSVGRGNVNEYTILAVVKGDTGVTINEEIKGDTAVIKGDTAVIKGDTAVIKGDTSVTQNHQEPSRTIKEPSGSAREKPKRSRQKRRELSFNIPPNLDTSEFRKTFTEDWPAARAEQKKPLTQRAVNLQLSELARYPPNVAAAMVKQSIMNQWQGIFPLKDNSIIGGSTNGNGGGQKYGYGDYDLTGIQAITADDIIKR